MSSVYDYLGQRADKHKFAVGDEVKMCRQFLKNTMMEDKGKMTVVKVESLCEDRDIVTCLVFEDRFRPEVGTYERSFLNLNLRHFKSKELE